MKTTILRFTIVFLTVFLLSACGTTQTTDQESSGTQVSDPVPSSVTASYSLDEVAQHSVRTDCWMVIDDGVYDVTEFIGQHPGGAAIVQGCGKDATAMFASRPGTGTPHSDSAIDRLPRYHIGVLGK